MHQMVNTDDTPATTTVPLYRDNVVSDPNASTFPKHPPDSTVPGFGSLPQLAPLNPRAVTLDMPSALMPSQPAAPPAVGLSTSAPTSASPLQPQPTAPTTQGSASQHNLAAAKPSPAASSLARLHDPLPLVSPDHSPVPSDDGYDLARELIPPSPLSKSASTTNGRLSKSQAVSKSGHKRKTGENSESASAGSTATDPAAAPPPKRRRGRPPKAKGPAAQAAAAALAAPTTVSRLKRGDPPPGAEEGWGTRLIKLDIDASNIITGGRPKRQVNQPTKPLATQKKPVSSKRGGKRATPSRALVRRLSRVAAVVPESSSSRKELRATTRQRPKRAARARKTIIDPLLLESEEELDSQEVLNETPKNALATSKTQLPAISESQPSAAQSLNVVDGSGHPHATSEAPVNPSYSFADSTTLPPFVNGYAPPPGMSSNQVASLVPMAPPPLITGFPQIAPPPDLELLAALYAILKVFTLTFVGEPRTIPPPPIIPGMAPVVTLPPPPLILEEELANFLLRAQVACANHQRHLLPSDYDRLRVLVVKNRLDGAALKWYFTQWTLGDPSYTELEQALELVWGSSKWRRHSAPPLQQLGEVGEYILRFELDRAWWPKGPTLQTAQHFAYGLQEPLRGMVLERLRQNPNATMTDVYSWTRFG